MCDVECGNLIDLSLEEDDILDQPLTLQPTIKTEHVVEAPTHSKHEDFDDFVPDAQFISPSMCKRDDSLDNNPFDCAQKLANHRQDDPFDIVEKEARFKARHAYYVAPVEVKLGKLLSLSNENLMSPVEDPSRDVDDKVHLKSCDLEEESPPVNLMAHSDIAATECNAAESDSVPISSAESAGSTKTKKALENRRRLLKLSVANSAFNTPASRRSSSELVEDSDTPGTPLSSLLSKSSQYNENLLAAESPLKFVDDDIMSEEPTSLLLEAEKNFEADLEMLKIPMLNKISSPRETTESFDIEKRLLDSLNNFDTYSNALAGLEAIKEKLKAKRIESSNNHHQDINSLISDLKTLINSGDSVNNKMKTQASAILETLSLTLSSSHAKDNLPVPSQQLNNCSTVPQPIKRQSTFDLELQEDEDLSKQPLVQEMPTSMVSSSATYDGDAPDERLDIELPEIDPLCCSPEHSRSSELQMQSDMTDIMEQLSKLIIHNNSGDNDHSTAQNPTFIVVMNPKSLSQNNSYSGAKDRSAVVVSSIENSMSDGSPELDTSSNSRVMVRRRSQSLSIHDKVKIVQVSLKPPTPKKLTMQKQYSIDVNVSPPVVVTTPPPDDVEVPEFKTPARMIRRNSYSSGTSFATAMGLRKNGFGSDGKAISHARRTQTLDTHHEGQQQQQQQKAIVRPMNMAGNMTMFKPDLKRKSHPHNESIMKSSGPLKATIPVKKVAPMIKTTPPSPGRNLSLNASNDSFQHQTNKMPTTPLKNSKKLAVGPNACSTPSGFTSPMRRLSVGVTKTRYSYMSATPNAKPSTSSLATSNSKRRTLSDFKVRSPLKPRVSSTGGLSAAATMAASTSSGHSAMSLRLSTSAGAKLPSKTPTKLTPNTAAMRPVNSARINASRLSGFGSTLTRNKENKNP